MDDVSDLFEIPEETPCLEDQNKKDIDENELTKRERIFSYVLYFLACVHAPLLYSPYLIVTFYVLNTPEKHWEIQDLAAVFAGLPIGRVTAGSMLSILSFCNILHFKYIFHLSQYFLGGVVAYLLMAYATTIDRPLALFVVGAVLAGNYNINMFDFSLSLKKYV